MFDEVFILGVTLQRLVALEPFRIGISIISLNFGATGFEVKVVSHQIGKGGMITNGASNMDG